MVYLVAFQINVKTIKSSKSTLPSGVMFKLGYVPLDGEISHWLNGDPNTLFSLRPARVSGFMVPGKGKNHQVFKIYPGIPVEIAGKFIDLNCAVSFVTPRGLFPASRRSATLWVKAEVPLALAFIIILYTTPLPPGYAELDLARFSRPCRYCCTPERMSVPG